MKKILLLSLAVGMLLASCQNNAKNKSYEGYDRTSNGLYYKFYEQNGGDNPQEMEILDVFMSCTINDTSIIIPQNRMIIQMMESMFVGDIFEGIKMMHIGDSASFLVRADSTFYTLFQSPVLPNEFNVDDMMKFEIRLNDFYPESEFAAKQIEYMKNNFPEETLMSENELNKYFKDNNIKPITTASGLNYVVTKEGNGEKPQIGTLIKVHYTGKLLDGTVFDSSVTRNEPIQFVLGIGQVIPGWDEALQLLSKGEKAVLYIPYYLAYGDRGAGAIPPFATLIFEVELVDF
ncbi:MAG: FKBP-type peptidyl-prolyl cis-trans isomerase [Methanobrevibacter sp.]|nr:FKBP-type peptidyl-prolyl cis-trans isomerase [Methanobrevibacter sp.]